MCTPTCRDGTGPGPVHDQSPAHWTNVFAAERHNVLVNFRGRAYEGSLVAEAGAQPRPLVLIVHNFQGLKFFDEHQAEYIARLGYVGLAIDMYGDAVPKEKRLWPEREEDIPAYMKMCFHEHFKTQHDGEGTRQLLQAWIDAGLAHNAVDSTLLPVMMGYCYGGGLCLEAIRAGLPLAGIQSLHGVPANPEYKFNPLMIAPDSTFFEKYGLSELVAELSPQWRAPVNNYNKSAVVLVEHGIDDDCIGVPMLNDFVKEFNDAGVDFVLHEHASTPHGFALPPSLGPPGKLHARADRRSTQSFLALCRDVWPHVPQRFVSHNAAGTPIPSLSFEPNKKRKAED